MNPRIARWAGWTMVLALVGALGLLYLLSSGKLLVSQRGALGGKLVNAEFRNSWPLVPGMTVRVHGAVAGTVESVELTDQGTAAVGLRLTRDIPQPRTDASAAIRQQDVLGDTYVDLELGNDSEPLQGAISAQRTLALPRLDELFSTFREPERQGLQALMTQLSIAAEHRGADLNAAILQLRPGMQALGDVLRELDNQEVDLRAVVQDAQRLSGQLADSSQDIDRGTQAMSGLLATTASRSQELDRLLANAPEGMAATRRALARVRLLTDAARPLALTLADAAPELRTAAPLIKPFSQDVKTTLTVLAPVISQLRATLKAAEPVSDRLTDLDPVDVLLPASGLLQVLSPVFGDGAKALFGADTYGADPKGQVGLGAIAVERGDQPTTPEVDPARMWLRTGVVLSCETFGVPIRPGCLAQLLGRGVDLLTPVNLRTAKDAKTPRETTQAAKQDPPADDAQAQVLDYLMR